MITAIASVFSLGLGWALFTEMVVGGFSWLILLSIILSYTVAYLCWPSRKRGKRKEEHWLLEIIESIIELPVDLVVSFIKIFARFGRDKDLDL